MQNIRYRRFLHQRTIELDEHLSDLEEVVIGLTPYAVWGKRTISITTSETLHKDSAINMSLFNVSDVVRSSNIYPTLVIALALSQPAEKERGAMPI